MSCFPCCLSFIERLKLWLNIPLASVIFRGTKCSLMTHHRSKVDVRISKSKKVFCDLSLQISSDQRELGLKCQVLLCCLITKNVFKESKPVRLNMYFTKPEAAAAFEHLAATVFWEPLKWAYRDTLQRSHNGCLMLQSFGWLELLLSVADASEALDSFTVSNGDEIKHKDFMEAVHSVFWSNIGPRKMSSRSIGWRCCLWVDVHKGNLVFFHPPDSVTFQ